MENSETVSTQIKKNKMETMPIGKLLFSMSVPAMFSMMILALYNIVDSIFVAHISEKALTAVSLAFPIQMLMFSFSVGTGIGICSVVSRRLGEKKPNEALTTAQTGFTFMLIFTLFFMILGLTAVKSFLSIYTDDFELVRVGSQYLKICTVCSIGCFMSSFCEKTLQSTGDTFHPMLIQLSGAAFNIIFDPILIFGYLGFPAMGVQGAAIATVLGQILSMILGIKFIKKNQYVSIQFTKIQFNKKSAKDILQVGIPAIIMQGIGTFMTSFMNAILIFYNIIATNVLGVYFKLESIIFMPVFGLNQGLMPILGYNYGAKNKERMLKALTLAIIVSFIIMCIGMCVFYFLPEKLLGMFNASDEMLAIGTVALKRISLAFPIAAFLVVIGALFQAMGDGYLSMITSIVRQIGLLIPAAYVFGKLWGLDAIWYSFIFAEIIAAVMNVFFFTAEKKNKLNF